MNGDEDEKNDDDDDKNDDVRHQCNIDNKINIFIDSGLFDDDVNDDVNKNVIEVSKISRKKSVNVTFADDENCRTSSEGLHPGSATTSSSTLLQVSSPTFAASVATEHQARKGFQPLPSSFSSSNVTSSYDGDTNNFDDNNNYYGKNVNSNNGDGDHYDDRNIDTNKLNTNYQKFNNLLTATIAKAATSTLTTATTTTSTSLLNNNYIRNSARKRLSMSRRSIIAASRKASRVNVVPTTLNVAATMPVMLKNVGEMLATLDEDVPEMLPSTQLHNKNEETIILSQTAALTFFSTFHQHQQQQMLMLKRRQSCKKQTWKTKMLTEEQRKKLNKIVLTLQDRQQIERLPKRANNSARSHRNCNRSSTTTSASTIKNKLDFKTWSKEMQKRRLTQQIKNNNDSSKGETNDNFNKCKIDNNQNLNILSFNNRETSHLSSKEKFEVSLTTRMVLRNVFQALRSGLHRSVIVANVLNCLLLVSGVLLLLSVIISVIYASFSSEQILMHYYLKFQVLDGSFQEQTSSDNQTIYSSPPFNDHSSTDQFNSFYQKNNNSNNSKATNNFKKNIYHQNSFKEHKNRVNDDENDYDEKLKNAHNVYGKYKILNNKTEIINNISEKINIVRHTSNRNFVKSCNNNNTTSNKSNKPFSHNIMQLANNSQSNRKVSEKKKSKNELSNGNGLFSISSQHIISNDVSPTNEKKKSNRLAEANQHERVKFTNSTLKSLSSSENVRRSNQLGCMYVPVFFPGYTLKLKLLCKNNL
ncbi:hypothetical protein HELRODRAFT_180984 [Helobdella robusta]|uniref:Uncharacterized protein n=1 Tax=Helobdella robusta TaxID=6412 RepID=T1FGH9_HELRO|nr:hypothetical protein HELRODRAFT_180984 [Helobdella robusta]ESN93445.1 hypothetical protein HELRODRAFT_180984 [Helobdella robusta]